MTIHEAPIIGVSHTSAPSTRTAARSCELAGRRAARRVGGDAAGSARRTCSASVASRSRRRAAARLRRAGRARSSSSSTRRSAVASCVDVAGLDQQRVDVVGRDVAVAVERAGDDRGAGGHRLDQHDAERLAVQRRRAEHVGALQAGDLVRVGQPAEPHDARVVRRTRRAAARCRGRCCRSTASTSSGELRIAAQQHVEALALLVTAAEEDRRPCRPGAPARRGTSSSSTPLNSISYSPPRYRCTSSQRVLRHGDAVRRGCSAAAHRRPAQVLVGCALAGGVERARRSARCAAACAVMRRPGDERLVEVEDVELLVGQRADRAQLARRVGRERRDRAVGRRSAGCCRAGVTNVAGGGPSHGPSTRTSMPIRRSSRLSPITCACTPPGIDRLYGHTMPTRSGAARVGPRRRGSRRRSVGRSSTGGDLAGLRSAA